MWRSRTCQLQTWHQSTPSWKTIGQRMHRTPESCRARWQWLKNTPSEFITRNTTTETEDWAVITDAEICHSWCKSILHPATASGTFLKWNTRSSIENSSSDCWAAIIHWDFEPFLPSFLTTIQSVQSDCLLSILHLVNLCGSTYFLALFSCKFPFCCPWLFLYVPVLLSPHHFSRWLKPFDLNMPPSRSFSRSPLRSYSHDRFFRRPTTTTTSVQMTPNIAQCRPVLIIVTFQCLCHVAEELCNSYLLTRSRQDDVPALSFHERQDIFHFCKQVELLMTRLLGELSGQVAVTWGVAIDPDELRLVWTDDRGTAFTIDGRLSVQQPLKINRPSWCREQDHGLDLDPTIFTDCSQPYFLRMVCRRR